MHQLKFMRLKGIGLTILICLLFLPLCFSHYGYLLTLPLFSFFLIAVLGATFLRLNIFVSSEHHGDRNIPKIALTFDDGPHPQTEEILNVLQKYQAKGSFFCIGQQIEKNPALAQRIVAEGHLIANHTYSHHKMFDVFPSQKMQADIAQCNAAIKNTTGVENVYFRPPYGVTNPPLAKAIRRAGLKSIGWSVRTYDTNKKSALELKNFLIKKVKNGDIILLHDRTPDLPQLLNEIIPYFQARGMELVTVKECLQHD